MEELVQRKVDSSAQVPEIPRLVVFQWCEFFPSLGQKLLSNLISVKVWGLLLSMLALYWGAMSSFWILLYCHLRGIHLSPTDMSNLMRSPGLLSGGELVTIWGIIYGIREAYRVPNHLDTIKTKITSVINSVRGGTTSTTTASSETTKKEEGKCQG